MVATVVVYFHPGRSIGSMLESDIFALAAFAYSVGMGLASMLTAVALHEAGLPLLSNIVVVLLFIGLAMALVGYARAKFVRPAFASACSLIGVILFTVCVRSTAQLGTANLSPQRRQGGQRIARAVRDGQGVRRHARRDHGRHRDQLGVPPALAAERMHQPRVSCATSESAVGADAAQA